MTPQLVDEFLSSADFRTKKPRTQSDYRRWALRFAKEFADDPARIFEDPRSRGEVNAWRDDWSHSPKQYDYAGTVVTVILNWARDAGKIREHHCDRLRKVYSSDRAEILWTPADIEAFNSKAPRWVRRILAAAVETGLRPGDLIGLNRSQVETTKAGRRLTVRTNKRGRIAAIPVTPRLASLIDETPRDRLLILANSQGRPLTEERASKAVTEWRRAAGLSDDLRLYDARGTAATRLLRAGLTLSQIAAHMGWSLDHASKVIEKYAAVSPEESDAVLSLLAHMDTRG
ncbi:tyrosine-type recombinase/integrase [Maritimibacter sp. DP07]|uniref:Tyrosine-type recombinase/integrase n=2 Tax=Maritimibacter harenae TaxID=2606218 RepID=A0A845MAH0_9RHOB|nr:tyrosine-type recombinase/integrase [Maritimibacter harenae]